jgi:hypothetical protein
MTDGELFTFLSQYADLPQAPDNVVGTTTEGPCIKCDRRNDAQMYEGSGMLFSKTVAEAFTPTLTPRVIPQRLIRHYLWANDFDESHVEHVAHVAPITNSGFSRSLLTVRTAQPRPFETVENSKPTCWARATPQSVPRLRLSYAIS